MIHDHGLEPLAKIIATCIDGAGLADVRPAVEKALPGVGASWVREIALRLGDLAEALAEARYLADPAVAPEHVAAFFAAKRAVQAERGRFLDTASPNDA